MALPDLLPQPDTCSTQNATRLLVLCTRSPHAPLHYLVSAAHLSHPSFRSMISSFSQPRWSTFATCHPCSSSLITHPFSALRFLPLELFLLQLLTSPCAATSTRDCSLPKTLISYAIPFHTPLFHLPLLSHDFLSPLPDTSFRSLLLRRQNPLFSLRLLSLFLFSVLSASMAEEKSHGCYK